MIIFLSYLLKVGLCIAAFYLAYKITLSKETFFKFNRLVLLGSIILSFIFPLWTITVIKEIAIPQALQINVGETEIAGQIYQNADNSGVSRADLLPLIGIGLYVLGVILFLSRNVFGIIHISRIMKHSRKEVCSDGRLFIIDKPSIPFSWFSNIIISEEDYIKNKEIIIEHEKAHISMGHSYDLIFINLMAVFQWFNPFIWLLRKELVSLHEFQADSCIINKGIDAKNYQYLLISKGTAQCFSIPVVNHLCSGNFKLRIKMMLKKRSNPQNALKALLLIPLVAGEVVAFAKTEYVETPANAEASYTRSNIPALAQNLQKQEGSKYFVDGKEVSEEVIKEMSLSYLDSHEISKRDHAVENRSPLEDTLRDNGIKDISMQPLPKSDSKNDLNARVSQTIKNQELSSFQILVESTNGDIKLTGIKGCAFIELTFKLNDEKSQAVDQFGMSTIDRDKPIEDKRLANFLFVIKKTKKGLSLQGIEGTAWKELSFNSTENKCYQFIDQNGMR